MLARILWVALGGAVGSVLRFVLASWFAARTGPGFPWGTFSVNVAGSFAMGVVLHAGLRAGLLPETARIALAAGLLGGFTTFSAFSAETWTLAHDAAWGKAAAYAVASVVACVVAVGLGVGAARAALGSGA